MQAQEQDFKVVRYSKEFYQQWNDFIDKSKNATFLFHRDFMEYHKDRFDDFSLLVFKNNKLQAVCPANISEGVVYSHQGLSYGGIIIGFNIRSEIYISLLHCILSYLKQEGIENLYIKEIPFIYHSKLSHEFEYFNSFLDSKCEKTDSYFVIDNRNLIRINRNRKRALKIAEINNLSCSQEGLKIFWEDVLSVNLQNRFQVSPVHTYQEIKKLMNSFPNNIKFYAVYKEGVMLAGVVMFITKNVAHFQYSSGIENRTETGALDFLFYKLIDKFKTFDYISFGSSSTDKTLKIDRGLAYWKESFNANLIPQRTYVIKTHSEINLDKIFK